MQYISRVQIENFRTIASVDFEMQHANVFIGPMGAGKSSIRGALEFAFTLRNEWTDGRGTGLKRQVRHGAARSSVTVMAGKYEVQRRVPPDTGAAKDVGMLYKALGMNGSIAECEVRAQACLRSCNLLEKDDVDQKGIFVGALRLGLDKETFFPTINALDPRWPDLGHWFDEQLGNRSKIAVIELEPFARFAREQRRVDNARHADLVNRVADLESKVRLERPPGSPEEEARVRDRRDAVARQLAEMDAAEGPAMAAFRAEHGAWVRHRETLARDSRRASEAICEEEMALASERAALEDAERRKAMVPAQVRPSEEIEAERDALAARVKSHRAESERLARDGRQAVDGSFDRECAPGECRAKALIEQRRKLADLQRQSAEEASAANALQGQCDALQREFEAILRHANLAAAVENARHRVAARTVDLEDAMANAARVEALPGAGPEPMAPVRDEATRQRLQAELRELTQDAELASAQSIQAQVYDHTEGELAVERERLAALAEDVERWNLLVRAFEPTKDPVSIPTRLLQTGLVDLAEAVDRSCRAYFGFGVTVQIDPWGIFLEQPTGQVYQKDASGGERVLMSAVIQVELARRAGFPLIMIDEVQRVDVLMREPLLKYLQAQEDVQSALFMAAQNKDGAAFRLPTAPKSPSTSFFWVENGDVTDAKFFW